MYDTILKQEIKKYAIKHAKIIGSNSFHDLKDPESAFIFEDISNNFHPKSWQNIQTDKNFKARTGKIHSHFKKLAATIYEMQSSNSSDALAMNIFCYPEIKKWKRIRNLFNIISINKVEFGSKPKIHKLKNGKIQPDTTEVDICINNTILCECKLTESDFTSAKKQMVESYQQFTNIFWIKKLAQDEKLYYNYQLIRNILAAEQVNGRFILICDMRRPDLAKSFYQTIRCIKDEYIDLRMQCEIIYWQDIAKAVGKELQIFLKEKYGI